MIRPVHEAENASAGGASAGTGRLRAGFACEAAPDLPLDKSSIWTEFYCLRAKYSQQLRQWWADLASDDAARAYRALWHLASHPQRSLPFLAARLRPNTDPTFERLPQLLGDLDDDAFRTRERASAELRKVAPDVEPILRQALAKAPSPEAHGRLQRLMDDLDDFPAGITLRDARAVGVLERIGGTEAVKILRKLAQGAPAASITCEAKAALQRLSTRNNLKP